MKKNENPQAVRVVCRSLIAVMDEIGATIVTRDFLETVIAACDRALEAKK